MTDAPNGSRNNKASVGPTPNICTVLTVNLCPSKEETEEHEALENCMTYDLCSNTFQSYRKNSSRDGEPAQSRQGLEWLLATETVVISRTSNQYSPKSGSK